MIVDESHYIKNRNAATTKYIVPLLQQAQRKILLTGTPALNRPEEVCFDWSLLVYRNSIAKNIDFTFFIFSAVSTKTVVKL